MIFYQIQRRVSRARTKFPYLGILTCTATDLPGCWRRAAPRFLSRTLVTYLIAPPGSGGGTRWLAPLSGRGASRAQPSSSRSKGDRWPILTVRNSGPTLSREHTDSYEARVAPEVWLQLKSEGTQAVRCTVAGATTTPAAASDRPADLIRRHFSPAAPDQLWVADFSHVPPGPAWSTSRSSSTPAHGGSRG